MLFAPLTCVLAAVASSPATAASRCAHASASPAHISTASAGHALRCLLNGERRHHGLRVVRSDRRLARAAVRHADDMAVRDYFDHVSPEGSTMDDRIRRTGYLRHVRAWSLGEALAWGADRAGAPRAILRKLMQSPPHRAILLDPSFRDVGIGVARGAPGPDGRSALTIAFDFGKVDR